MADYYPLIARALEGLGNNTADARRTLYERARAALVAQLRGIDPPLSETEITRERSALENAIRKVEAELEGKARAEPSPASSDSPRGVEPHASARSRLLGARTSERPPQDLKMFRKSIAAADDLDVVPPQTAAPSRDAHNDFRAGQPHEFSDEHEATWDHAARADYEQAPDLLEDNSATMHDEQHIEPGRPPVQRPLESADYHREPRPPRSYRGLAQIVTALVILLGVCTVVYWQWSNIGLFQHAHRQPPAATPKSQSGPATAQRVVLYEEDSGNPRGKQYTGSAIWRTETVSPGSGLAPELQIRADLTIPERNMTVIWSMRRNTDQALPASHTIEIMFNLPPDFPSGGIANVPGVGMRESEQARGQPLAGLAVKVINGYFLIGLSAADVQQNMQLLKQRPWFGIPIIYNNGGRASLALEKGPSGDRAFADAFAAWGN
jgi:hypothetical protein